MATEPTESTDPVTTFFLAPPPPRERLIDAGLLRMKPVKRSGGKGNNKSGAVGRLSVGSVANPGVGRRGPHHPSTVCPKFLEEEKNGKAGALPFGLRKMQICADLPDTAFGCYGTSSRGLYLRKNTPSLPLVTTSVPLAKYG